MNSCAQATVDRRTRGTHSTRVKNTNPTYTVPDSHIRRPAFIRDLVEASQSRDVTRADEARIFHKWNGRQKHFYADRRRAINALHAVFCEHVNLATHQIEISLRNASDAAGLTTVSDAELQKAKNNPAYIPQVSISRASRALADMVELGWILDNKAWQVWDKEAGAWIDKYFEATEVFFNVAGITSERVEKQRNARIGRYKKDAMLAGKSAEEVGRMSLTELKEARRMAWYRKSFERRALEIAKKRTFRLLHGKTRQQQRQIAQDRVLDRLGDSLSLVTHGQFKDMVNHEIAMLRKSAGLPPPLH
ncbi:MAG: hypothetical protein LPH21_16195 [Shewanella sp.]|nr:hypothetical protein [Shewanella sp.]